LRFLALPHKKIAYYAWEIEKIELFMNWIWPICLYNKGNELDLAAHQKYLEIIKVSNFEAGRCHTRNLLCLDFAET
jgi:hypothetical protein